MLSSDSTQGLKFKDFTAPTTSGATAMVNEWVASLPTQSAKQINVETLREGVLRVWYFDTRSASATAAPALA